MKESVDTCRMVLQKHKNARRSPNPFLMGNVNLPSPEFFTWFSTIQYHARPPSIFTAQDPISHGLQDADPLLEALRQESIQKMLRLTTKRIIKLPTFAYQEYRNFRYDLIAKMEGIGVNRCTARILIEMTPGKQARLSICLKIEISMEIFTRTYLRLSGFTAFALASITYPPLKRSDFSSCLG